MTADRVLVVPEAGRAELVDEEPAPVPDGGIRITIDFSGLSAGTELAWFKGTNPWLGANWDAELGLFDPGRAGAGYPVRRIGYMEAGTVVETRSLAHAVGDRVALACGHRTGAVADPSRDHVVVLPPDLEPLLGIYVAHMGPICANGLLHAAAELGPGDVGDLGDGVRGRTVLVTGAGVVGLLTALFAAHHGAEEVLVADRTPERLAVAAELGFVVVDEGADDAGRVAKTRWRHGPADHGADVAFQCRGRPESLATALRGLRPQGTAVDLAFYQDGADALRLGEEFHHNGLSIRSAQISRVPRGTAHRWDRRRLSAETVALLRAHGPAICRHLVTDVVPLVEAPALLADLAARRRHVLQAVFTG